MGMFPLSCTSKDNYSSYKVGSSYLYEVSIITSNDTIVTDTLILKTNKKGILGRLLGMNMSMWTSLSNPSYKEKRGVNLSEGKITIQTPLKLDYLEYEHIVIAGYPTYSSSMKINYSSVSTHTFVKGYGVLSGKALMQSSKIVDSSSCTYNDESYLCKVSKGQNDSHVEEFGLYILKTYFHEEYGFICLEYRYPTDEKIIFRLVDIKNEP